MTRTAFVVLVGLLPLWVAILVVGYLAVGDSSTLVVTPWLIIVAVPACAVSLLLVFATLAVHSRVKGDESRRFKVSLAVFAAGVATIVATALFFLHQRQTLENDVKRETQMASKFVAEHQAVRLAVGDAPKVNLSSSTISRDGPMPVKYDFSVIGSKTVYAIVAVDRSGGVARFSMACITPLSLGQREAFKDACRSSNEKALKSNISVNTDAWRRPVASLPPGARRRLPLS